MKRFTGVPEGYASRVPSGEIATVLPSLLGAGNETSAPKSTSNRTSGRFNGWVARHGAHSAIA